MKAQPKSVRLNKKHRGQIVESVMQEWEKRNPPPNVSKLDLFKSVYPDLITPPENACESAKAFAKVIEQTVAVNEIINPVPDRYKNLFSAVTVYDLRIKIIKAGQEAKWLDIMIPKAIADELGIPYHDTLKVCYGPDSYNRMAAPEYIPYLDENDEIEIIYLVSDNRIFSIEENSAIRRFFKNKRQYAIWEKQRNSMREEVADFLEQFNTTAQIRETWPEIVDFLPAPIADPTAVIKLPAITTSRLNERLGLTNELQSEDS